MPSVLLLCADTAVIPASFSVLNKERLKIIPKFREHHVHDLAMSYPHRRRIILYVRSNLEVPTLYSMLNLLQM
jgi:hypothetical protein